jgi:hypothetical protein
MGVAVRFEEREEDGILALQVFGWEDDDGITANLDYYEFIDEFRCGEEIPLDRLQRWRLP